MSEMDVLMARRARLHALERRGLDLLIYGTETQRMVADNWRNVVPWRLFPWLRQHREIKRRLDYQEQQNREIEAESAEIGREMAEEHKVGA